MRTLAYCTGFALTPQRWDARYRPWLDAMRRMGIADQILIVDDGSPELPGWSDTRLSSGATPADALAPDGSDHALLHHFTDRRGRLDVFDCPGWHRSYAFGVDYAVHHGFDRVVHVESDAFLLSDRMADYVRGVTDQWVALWTERYQFPELAIQFAAGAGLAAMHDFTQRPYSGLIGQVHEYLVPFTHIEKGLVGDRHGETNGPVPRGLDYVCQIPLQREAPYYWWLPQGARFAEGAVREDRQMFWNFGPGGESDQLVGDGWSGQCELDYRWMTGYSSTLRLPELPHAGDWVLRFNAHPQIHKPVILQQTLRVLVNGHHLADFEIDGELILGTLIPAHILRRDGSDIVTFVHPDGMAPTVLLGTTEGDDRVVSVALRSVALLPVEG